MRNTNTVARHRSRKRVLKAARGFWGNRHRLYCNALEQVRRSRRYSFFGRKIKKRDFRALWILRLSIACRNKGLNYSRFMCGLKRANIELDRKQLSEMAIHHPEDFNRIFETAKACL